MPKFHLLHLVNGNAPRHRKVIITSITVELERCNGTNRPVISEKQRDCGQDFLPKLEMHAASLERKLASAKQELDSIKSLIATLRDVLVDVNTVGFFI